MNDSTTVLVADDQLLVRAGVEKLLAGMPEFSFVGAVADGAGCLQALAGREPDVLLLDVKMPGIDGLAVAEAVRARHPAVRIVILSAHADAALARRALLLGVSGVVSKDFVLDELVLALRTVMTGRTWLSPELALAAVAAPQARLPLSRRQLEVLRGIARGASNKQMAREFGVSVKTVEYHRGELIQRLDLHDVASLTRYAVANGLVE